MIGNQQPSIIKSVEIQLWKLLFDIVSAKTPIPNLLVTALADISVMGIRDPQENYANWFTGETLLVLNLKYSSMLVW
jgi:hypothetical protein